MSKNSSRRRSTTRSPTKQSKELLDSTLDHKNSETDSKTFKKINEEFYYKLRKKKKKMPNWFGILDNRVFTNYHRNDKKKAIDSAERFANFIDDFDFEISHNGYELLEKGLVAIWGYDRRMRPVIFIDIFEFEIKNRAFWLEAVNLTFALAYSKMMFPGVNDGLIIVLDTSFRHFYESTSVTFLNRFLNPSRLCTS